MLAHFYHIYADGNYEGIVQDHLEALIASELYDNLDMIAVGLVGDKHNCVEAVELLEYYGSKFDIEVIAREGWEQVTLQCLHDWAKENDGKVLYAHTKGAWSNTELSYPWRETMTDVVVNRWQEAVEALDMWDTAGAFWILSHEPEHEEHDFFYGGNFWWATTDYLRKLPPVKNDNRYQAEGWIGLAQPTAHIMWPGYPFWGNFLKEGQR